MLEFYLRTELNNENVYYIFFFFYIRIRSSNLVRNKADTLRVYIIRKKYLRHLILRGHLFLMNTDWQKRISRIIFTLRNEKSKLGGRFDYRIRI